MIACDSKFYLAYLNKLVDQCNNTYHHSINEKPVNVYYSALTLKWMIEIELPSIKIILVKVTRKIGQEKYLLLILFWKLILGLIKLKI